MSRHGTKEQYDTWVANNRERRRELDRNFLAKHRPRIKERLQKFHLGRPLYAMVKRAKKRAKETGVPFDLDDRKLFAPAICPVLGIILDYEVNGHVAYNSPSLDQIIPRGGYTMDNVRIISHRANTLKSDATLEEVRLILADMEKIFV